MNGPAAESPADAPPPRRRRRRVFRACRITVLLAALLLAGALGWLQFLGVPEGLKARAYAELRRRGVDARADSVQFALRGGLLARGLRVRLGPETNAAVLRIPEARLRLRPPPWREELGLLRGLEIRGGEAVLPLPATEEHPRPRDLVVREVAAELAFLPGNVVQVVHGAADMLGGRLEFGGTLTNLLHLTRRPAAPPDPAGRDRLLAEARHLLEQLEGWRIAGTPRLRLAVAGDAARPGGLAASLLLTVPEADTPRGYVRDFGLALRLPPGPAGEPSRPARFTLSAAEARNGDGGVEGLRLEGGLTVASALEVPTNAAWSLHVRHLHRRGLRARDVELRLTNHLAAALPPRELLRRRDVPTDFVLAARRLEAGPWLGGPVQAATLRAEGTLGRLGTNLVPLEAALRLDLAGLQTATGTVARATLDAAWRPAAAPRPSAPELDFWNHLLPFAGEASLAFADIASPAFTARRLETALRWDGARLGITRLAGELYGGRLDLAGELDVPGRELQAELATSFDLHGLDPLLGPAGRENFGRFQWRDPPAIEGGARLGLPPWDTRGWRWEDDLEPRFQFTARFRTGPASFKGLPVDSAAATVSFDAGVWRLPDLATSRPEGAQAVDIHYVEKTGEYRIAGRGRVLPPVLKPVLGEASAEVLDLFTFPEGVEADVVVFGPWTKGYRMSIAGVLAATNLTFRGERFDSLSLGARYTNRLMVLTNVAAARDGAPLTADAAAYDFAADRVFLTNAVSRLEPLLVARLINEDFPDKVRHYRFGRPPRIVANGTFERARTDTAALRFHVDGEDFAFWRLRAAHITADLDWAGGWLTLTNLNASFYDGALDGWAAFHVDAEGGDTPYRFDARVRSGRLGPLVRDAASSASRIEGTFDLDLHVASALTSDVMTWNGHGSASLTNGLIWDVPVFGFLSRTLDAVSPGLGSQRFDRASAAFTLTNGVFHTANLQMHSPLVRLDYRGTVDLEGRLDTRVEARVLRNVGLLGPLVSVVTAPLTKLFEFRVGGTLTDPEPQPVYVPRFLFWPFQALGWVAGGFRGGDRDDGDDALANVVPHAPAAGPAPVPSAEIPPP